MEESKRNLDESQSSLNISSENNSTDAATPLASKSAPNPATPATPDYAAGLTAMNPPTPSLVVSNNKSPIHAPSTPLQQPSTPYSQPVTPYFQAPPTPQPRTPQTPSFTPVIIGSGKKTENIPKYNINRHYYHNFLGVGSFMN